MPSITISQTIAAPIDRVFQTVADIRQFSRALPHVMNVEFLTETRTGLGTRFRETRLMNRKEMATELEVTEYVENECVRMIADSHGTVWDSTFTVAPKQSQTILTLTMDARAHKLLPRIMNPLIMGMVKKGVARDMEMVKAFCEDGG